MPGSDARGRGVGPVQAKPRFRLDSGAAFAYSGAEMLRQGNIYRDERRTSVRLEPDYWEALKEIADREGVSASALMARINDDYPEPGDRPRYTSWIRLWCLRYLRELHRQEPPGLASAKVPGDAREPG